jgi:uncharacterized protein (TIGR03000 family)
MIRIATALAVFSIISTTADAQIRINQQPGRPAGVIQSPSLPLPGSPLQHMTVAPPKGRPYLVANPYGNLRSYAPYWPVWYDQPPIVAHNVFPLPVPAPTPMSVIVAPAVPVELRAKLTLHVPFGAKVFLAGKEVDAAAIPLILESPVLREGQAYAFDVKVTWLEGSTTEERARVVTIEGGQSKSLTYR